MKWRDKANCTNVDPHIFFQPDTTDIALAVCSLCAVRSQCLDEALYGSEYGVRGGLTEEERRRYFIPREINGVKVVLEEDYSSMSFPPGPRVNTGPVEGVEVSSSSTSSISSMSSASRANPETPST